MSKAMFLSTPRSFKDSALPLKPPTGISPLVVIAPVFREWGYPMTGTLWVSYWVFKAMSYSSLKRIMLNTTKPLWILTAPFSEYTFFP